MTTATEMTRTAQTGIDIRVFMQHRAQIPRALEIVERVAARVHRKTAHDIGFRAALGSEVEVGARRGPRVRPAGPAASRSEAK